MSTVYLFPGQGSQHKGMGKDLFDTTQQYELVEYEINRILGYSLREVCLENPDNLLNQTQYTQPCLYVVNALHYLEQSEEHIPSTVAGHSLGEYNALWAAGAFDFLTGLRIVKKRGELMAKAKGGGMAAIIGLEIDRISNILKQNKVDDIDIANKNSPEQSVISGPVDSINRVNELVSDLDGVACIALPVSAAFHSRYMQPAGDEFSQYLSDLTFYPLNKTVIANVSGATYPEDDPNKVIPDMLSRQLTSPVEWAASMSHLRSSGFDDFKEVGPGNILTKLMSKNTA